MNTNTEATTRYHVDINNEGEGSIFIFSPDGDVKEVRSDDLIFTRVLGAVTSGGSLDDVDLSGAATITKLSEHITLVGNEVQYKGQAVDTSLATAIDRYHTEGRDMSGLVKFMDRLYDTQFSYQIRSFAFEWLTRQQLEVTPEGTILGYRGLMHNKHSVHAGKAWVDGVEHNGHIPNFPGTTVHMPREMVDDDKNTDCSHGLHVGSESYARNWAQGALVIVEVDPADIVSVPSYSTNKMRVCRYKVLEEILPQAPKPDFEAQIDMQNIADALPEATRDTWVGRLRKAWGNRR